MNLYTIDTGFFKLDGGAMFGVVPKSIWSRRIQTDENNLCTWSMRCLLIEVRNRLVLIDTGLGNKQSKQFFSYVQPHGDADLLSSIKQCGFSPDEVTDVILTHLHFDHAGGAVSRDSSGKLFPTFKHATYWSHSNHWDWAKEPNVREEASFLTENFEPLQQANQLAFVDQTLLEIPEIDFMVMNGHTESQLIPTIKYKEKTIVYCADLLPSVHHIPMPYVMGYDVRPLVTMSEKATFFNEAIQEEYILFFEHDAQNECCTLKQGERRVEADKLFRLSEL